MASAAAAVSASSAAAANTTTKKMITRWSLNSLARIGKKLKQHHTPACLEVSRDITLRLGEQQAHLEQLESLVDQSLLLHANNNRNSITKKEHRPNVIKTSNFSDPHWWNVSPPTNFQQQQSRDDDHTSSNDRNNKNNNKRQKQQQQQQEQKRFALEKAKKNLRNLKVLHESTYDMVDQLWRHLEAKPTGETLEKKEQKWIKACLRQVRDRHAMTVENLAEFVIETRPYLDSNNSSNSSASAGDGDTDRESVLDSTVRNFLRGRFGVQFLCEHAVSDGIIGEDCHLQDVLEDAIAEARLLCESHYSHLATAAPDVVIVHQTKDRNDQFTFTIVRPWVHYVLVELLKNAMSASMERFSQQQEFRNNNVDDNEDHEDGMLPPNIYITMDDEHHNDDNNAQFLSIDLFDQGGGFPSNKKPDDSVLFGFVKNKTTMWDRLDDQQTYAMTRSPMQGLGVGLCLSKLMMSHFGGTVELNEHPPLLRRQQEQLQDITKDLDAGCVASIKLQKDLDYPEQLYDDDVQ